MYRRNKEIALVLADELVNKTLILLIVFRQRDVCSVSFGVFMKGKHCYQVLGVEQGGRQTLINTQSTVVI